MAAGNGTGRATPRKAKATSNGNGNGGIAKATAEILLGHTLPERTINLPVGDAAFEVRMRAATRKQYDDLVSAHPNADGSWPPYAIDTFAPALIAACLVEPELTPEQVAQLWETWEIEPLNVLWDAAMDLSTGWSPRDALGKGLSALASMTPTSGSAPATPSTTESATAN